MSNQRLGNVPGLTHVSLIDGQDFADELTAFTDLPVGSEVAIEFLTAARDYSYGVWPVIDLAMRIDAADHAIVPNGSWCRIWLTYPDDGGRFCPLAGPVERNRR